MNFKTTQPEIIFNQAIHPPFDEMGLVEAHHKLVSQNIQWSGIGILIDQNAGEQKAALLVLLEKDKIVAVFRVCLGTPEQTLDAIRLFIHDKSKPVILRACQGEFFTTEQIRSTSAK